LQLCKCQSISSHEVVTCTCVTSVIQLAHSTHLHICGRLCYSIHSLLACPCTVATMWALSTPTSTTSFKRATRQVQTDSACPQMQPYAHCSLTLPTSTSLVKETNLMLVVLNISYCLAKFREENVMPAVLNNAGFSGLTRLLPLLLQHTTSS
jgi:hypothetical protein